MQSTSVTDYNDIQISTYKPYLELIRDEHHLFPVSTHEFRLGDFVFDSQSELIYSIGMIGKGEIFYQLIDAKKKGQK